MVERGRGAVLNIASLIAFQPVPFQATYGATKAAVLSFTEAIHEELRGSGVTVNSLHPATYMNTTMVRTGGITPMSTVEQGGDAILHLVTGDDVASKSGLFFNGMNEARANPQAYDADARRRLRALSLDLTGLSS